MNIESYFLHKDSTIQDTLQALERNEIKIVLVVDEKNKLMGTVTDGDVRRGILSGKQFSENVQKIMATKPIIINEGTPKEIIIEKMIESRIRQIIIVNNKGAPVSIKSIEEIDAASRKENWVVLMAGGLGSRLGHLTENTPKPMLTVGGQPILEILINHFKGLGFYKFYICVNYKADKIMKYFDDGARHGVRIRYIQEKEKLDTAGALSLMPEKPQLPFFVANGDIVISLNFEAMLNFHTEHKSHATMAIRKYTQKVPYGVVEVQDYKIHNFIEKPEKDHFINAGIYLIEPDLLDLLEKGKACTMPTLFTRARDKNLATFAFPIQEYWIDIGQPSDYHQANVDFIQSDE